MVNKLPSTDTGLQNQVEALKEKGFTPKLSVILVGNDGASQSYVRSKRKQLKKLV